MKLAAILGCTMTMAVLTDVKPTDKFYLAPEKRIRIW
jgi:predicted metalloendopeptidase